MHIHPTTADGNPLLGYGSDTSFDYTASPLRAFENELAGTMSSSDSTWYALADANGFCTTDCCGEVSIKDRVGDDSSTAFLLFAASVLPLLLIAQFCLNVCFTSGLGLFITLLSVAVLPGWLMDVWSSPCCFLHSLFTLLHCRLRTRRSRRRLCFAGRFIGRRRFLVLDVCVVAPWPPVAALHLVFCGWLCASCVVAPVPGACGSRPWSSGLSCG